MSHHDDDVVHARVEKRADDSREKRVGGVERQRRFRATHARRTSGGEHDGGNHRPNVIESRAWPRAISRFAACAAALRWTCAIRVRACRGRPTSSGCARGAAGTSGRRIRRPIATRPSLPTEPALVRTAQPVNLATFEDKLDDDLDDDPDDDDDDRRGRRGRRRGRRG